MGVVQAAASACVMADALACSIVADVAGWHDSGCGRVLVDSSQLVDLAPWATWRVPAPPPWLMARLLRLPGRMVGSGAPPALHGPPPPGLWASSLPACGCGSRWRRRPNARAVFGSRLRVTAMDVGQGDAFLVTFPDGQTLLVDAGGVSTRGDFDIGDRVLGPALRARGLGRVDYVAVTHGDPDHIGGAAAVVRDFAPREVWVGVPVAGHQAEAVLQAAARDRRSGWRWLQRGDRMQIGEVELRVHHPSPPDWERQRVRNDDSLVIEVR